MRFDLRVSATAAVCAATCSIALAAPSVLLAGDHDDTSHEETAAEPAIEKTKGEIRLAKLLEGREAGEPISCIRQRPNDNVQVIDNTAIVYGRGNTIYVNYTKDPDDLDDSDVLVSRRFGAHKCKSDIVTKVDNINGVYAGNVFLSDFIPYKRVKKDAS